MIQLSPACAHLSSQHLPCKVPVLNTRLHWFQRSRGQPIGLSPSGGKEQPGPDDKTAASFCAS